MTQKEKALDRGDIIIMDFDPQAGSEIMKRRPAMVISPKIYNQKSTTIICCPITSKTKSLHPWQVKFPSDFKVEGAVIADQVKSMDWRARKVKKVTVASADVIEEVLERILCLVS